MTNIKRKTNNGKRKTMNQERRTTNEKQRTKNIFLYVIFILLSITFLKLSAHGEVTVVTEEYVPKVVIEAKWGTNKGEFGRSSLGEGTILYQPDSLAVDSKGNIYILDIVNNRIQKFDKEGRYIKSLRVESYKGWAEIEKVGIPIDWDNPQGEVKWVNYKYIHPVKALGINIAIDSEDILYYYCIKDSMIQDSEGKWVENPSAVGEIWQFKDDVLVRKWEVPVGDELVIEEDVDGKEKVWIKGFPDGKVYNATDKKWLTKEEYQRIVDMVWEKKICKIGSIKVEKEGYVFKILTPKGEQIKVITDIEKKFTPILVGNKLIRIYDKQKKLYKYYNFAGNLIKVEKPIIPSPDDYIDKRGNVYELIINSTGLRIKKWEIQEK